MKYTKELPRRMYLYFADYEDARSCPSFVKFAKSIGSTKEELEGFRARKEFDRAWRVCDEIRRDYLTDKALTKHFDPSFVKFLLSDGALQNESEDSLSVKITVKDDGA
jgi:hypothetical protein